MPCAAWGIPAKYCKTGAKLRKTPNTVCRRCYARKGRFAFGNVKAKYESRYQHWLTSPNWVDEMKAIIRANTTFATPYFRWFDSGDLQSPKMLAQIENIALDCPQISFWLPTQEKKFLRKRRPVSNLTIRLSQTFIDAQPNNGVFCTSSVISRAQAEHWPNFVAANETLFGSRYYCPASIRNGNCGDCRACWDHNIDHIFYLEH